MCNTDFIPTFNSSLFKAEHRYIGASILSFCFYCVFSTSSANTSLSLCIFPVPTKGEVATLHMGTLVITAAADHKKWALVAGVAITDAVSSELIPILWCNVMVYISHRSWWRGWRARNSHHWYVQADIQNHILNLSLSFLEWKENFCVLSNTCFFSSPSCRDLKFSLLPL